MKGEPNDMARSWHRTFSFAFEPFAVHFFASLNARNDYAQAWHKLNFHMNCNLSIVDIQRNTQCLFCSPVLIFISIESIRLHES